MTKTTVNRAANGQYRTTVPKDIADGFELDGKQLEWQIKSGNKIEATIIDV